MLLPPLAPDGRSARTVGVEVVSIEGTTLGLPSVGAAEAVAVGDEGGDAVELGLGEGRGEAFGEAE